MSEPGAVSGTITQSNPQGGSALNYAASLNIASSGTDSLQISAPSGGVGFGDSAAVGADTGTGQEGEHDEIRGDEFAEDVVAVPKDKFMMENYPESPFYTYNSKPLSNGREQMKQKYHPKRDLGRGQNISDIRNGYYYGNEESSIFTWDLKAQEPNITKGEISNLEDEELRDV